MRAYGVLITPVDASNPRISALRDRGTGVVMVDRIIPGQEEIWSAVGVDDVRGGVLAVEHLLERGHERIAFVGGPRDLPQVTDRRAGAARALKAAGIDPRHLVEVDTSNLTFADGRLAGERLLGISTKRRPTAAFCANDLVAAGLLQHLTLAGVPVPEDLAIIGYDDIEYAAAAAVPLSSIAQPRHKLGQSAARLLLEQSDGAAGHAPKQLIFTPELVARASTAV